MRAVPDDAPKPVGDSGGVTDYLDLLFAFRKAYPALLDSRRMPCSWKDFLYGMAHLNRENARENIRIASAVGIGMSGESDEKRGWHRLQRIQAGWIDA